MRINSGMHKYLPTFCMNFMLHVPFLRGGKRRFSVVVGNNQVQFDFAVYWRGTPLISVGVFEQ